MFVFVFIILIIILVIILLVTFQFTSRAKSTVNQSNSSARRTGTSTSTGTSTGMGPPGEAGIVVGFYLPQGNNPGVRNSFKLAIQDTQAKVQLIEQDFVDVNQLATFIQQFEQQYANVNRLIIAGRTTDQLLTASKTLQSLNSSTLAISLASSAPSIEGLANVASMMYTDDIASTTLLMYVKLIRQQRLVILFDMQNQYAVEYSKLLQTKAPEFGIKSSYPIPFTDAALDTATKTLLSEVKTGDVIIFIGTPDELYEYRPKWESLIRIQPILFQLRLKLSARILVPN